MERAKRFGLAALIAFLAPNVWTGSPLLALWIGSRVQGSESQPSMGAYAAVIGCLVPFSFVLYQALKRVSHAYQDATGTLPTVRTHAPWLRSLRGERPDHATAVARASPEPSASSSSLWYRRRGVRGLVLLLGAPRSAGAQAASTRAAQRPILAVRPIAQLDRAAAF
jgi:hypothetical protein